MRILVIGATGGTGREVVRQALARNHQVNALARSAANAVPLLPGADIIEGDARDGEAVAKALTGCDGVISALGTKLSLLREETLLSTATRVLIDAMRQQGITRLVCVTGIGAGDSHGHGGFLYDHIVQPLLLRSTYHDKDRQEDEIRKSGLDWTIVRPTNLTDGPTTDNIRALTDLTDFHGGRIARADVARFLITELDERRWAGRSPVITSAAAPEHKDHQRAPINGHRHELH
jgi:putative NADH-flavin reductase